MEEVEKFDPSQLMQGVKDRIKATFVSLIPDAQWEIMVLKEIDAFFNATDVEYRLKESKTQKDDYWNTRYMYDIVGKGPISPFRQMVWDFCYEQTTIHLKHAIQKEYFDGVYNKSAEVEGGLKKIIAEIAPVAAVRFFEEMTRIQMQRLAQEIQNHR